MTNEETFTYDENGNLTEVTDRKSQVTTFTYDALDRQTQAAYYDSSTTDYTYDAGDRVTEIDDSIAGVIEREYDLLDRLTEETTPEGLVTYTYDGADRRATMTVDGESAVSYAYDTADRLTSITKGSSVVEFTYDSANRRTVLELPNGVTTETTYDAASQITALTYKLGVNTLGDLTYTYDVGGNRTALGGSWARTGLPTALTSATYNAGNQIATWGATSFTYDDNGNLTSDGSKTYSWNARNQLTGLSGGVSASFAYDGLGRRRSKTVGGTSTAFLYDGLNAVQELTGGSPTANILAGLGIDEWFTRTDSTTTRHLLTDPLGSTAALTDGSGAVQTEYTYEPFGVTSMSGSSTTNRSGFTGREDDGTGLYYFRNRYQHPTLQRFISEDPIGINGGVNLFAYAANQPTGLTDALGLKPGDRFSNNAQGGGGSGRDNRNNDDKRDDDDRDDPRNNDPRNNDPRNNDNRNGSGDGDRDQKPSNCPTFGQRWRESVSMANSLPGWATPSGLTMGFGASEAVVVAMGYSRAIPVGIFSAPVAAPMWVTGTAFASGALLTGASWWTGTAIGAAVDAALLHPCAF